MIQNTDYQLCNKTGKIDGLLILKTQNWLNSTGTGSKNDVTN